MVYVFEGARNSGKTFLSKYLSERCSIPRFQFDFAGGMSLLKIPSSESREAHAFAMGKELILMQLCRDFWVLATNFIHDRGILSVLTWALIEKRISEDELQKQIDYIFDNDLLSGIHIFYIDGDNPDKAPRNKDNWDFADGNSEERETYERLLAEFEKRGFNKIYRFTNHFTEQSAEEFFKFYENTDLL